MGGFLGSIRSGKQRTDAFLAWTARCVGMLGTLCLFLCALLLSVPDEVFPPFLDRDHLPEYAWVSLLAASLLGWTCLQTGMGELREGMGGTFGAILIVFLPLVCFVVTELDLRGVIAIDEWPHARGYRIFAFWYPALVVAAGILAYVHDRSTHTGRISANRAMTGVLLVMPYILLVGFLALGIPLSSMSDGMRTSLHHLGATAVLLQIGLAYFFGTTSGV